MRILHRTMQSRSYLTNRGDRVEFVLDGRDSVGEGGAEDDAVSSGRKVWYMRQLVQESGAQPRGQKRLSILCISLWQILKTAHRPGALFIYVCQQGRYWLLRFVQQLNLLFLWCLVMVLDPLQFLWLNPLQINHKNMTHVHTAVPLVKRNGATYIFIKCLDGLQVHHRVVHCQYGCKWEKNQTNGWIGRFGETPTDSLWMMWRVWNPPHVLFSLMD